MCIDLEKKSINGQMFHRCVNYELKEGQSSVGGDFLSVHVFPGNRTHNLCAANAML